MRGEGERNEPERNDNGIMTKYTITRVIEQTRITYNIEQTERIVSLVSEKTREEKRGKTWRERKRGLVTCNLPASQAMAALQVMVYIVVFPRLPIFHTWLTIS